MNPLRRWRTWLANRRHNRALRAALLACPGRQLMFRVVDGRMVVDVEGDAPTVPPVPSGVTLNWMDDEQTEEAASPDEMLAHVCRRHDRELLRQLAEEIRRT